MRFAPGCHCQTDNVEILLSIHTTHNTNNHVYASNNTVKHLIELYVVQKEQIWFGKKSGPAGGGLTSSQSPFCNPTPYPRCNPNPQVGNPNPNPNPKSPSKFLQSPKCCRFCAQKCPFSVLRLSQADSWCSCLCRTTV